MRFSSLSALALFLGLTTSAPAYAFDDLIRSIGLMPPVVDGIEVFRYVSPARGFDVIDAMSLGVANDDALNMALLAGEQDDMTGIDYGQVTSVLTTGEPPAITTVIFGTSGFASGAPEALLARDFTATARGGQTIYALGADFALDFAAATSGAPDPLGSGTGKSQRLAIDDDHIIRTASWPEIGVAISTMETPPAYTQIWSETIGAMRTVAGDYAHLELASGWTMFAFSDPGPMFTPGDLPAPGAKIKLKTPELEPALAFPFAIFGITLDDEVAGLHIAIPYGNEAMAREAGEIIVSRLADFPMDDMPEARITVVPETDATVSNPVLVVTMEAAAPDRADILALYTRFTDAIYRREFRPLMSGI